MEDKELEIIQKHVEKLGLDMKSTVTMGDLSALRTSLRSAGEFGMADWAEHLGGPEDLEDFIVNIIYG